MNDVEPRFYTTVIREMIRHENDVSNHRIMWLLIGQGLIANAYVSAGSHQANVVTVLSVVGILVTLSAFVILYKSYQARGYLQFLGDKAKQGALREEELPLFGWPPKRIKGWWRNVWVCPWLGKTSDLLEPYFFLPGLLGLAWLFVLASHQSQLAKGILLIVCVLLTLGMFSGVCIVWVWLQRGDEAERP
jgi:hypothetical protein